MVKEKEEGFNNENVILDSTQINIITENENQNIELESLPEKVYRIRQDANEENGSYMIVYKICQNRIWSKNLLMNTFLIAKPLVIRCITQIFMLLKEAKLYVCKK